MDYLKAGQYKPLPSSCMILDPQVRVEGPFDKKEARFGDSNTEFVLIGVADGRKLWTMASWIVFDSNDPKPAKVEAGTYYAIREANVREEAGLKGSLLFSLPKGAQVTFPTSDAVLVDGYTWAALETSDGRWGWSAVKLFSNIKPSSTTSQPLHFRIKAALDRRFAIDAVDQRGTKITIVFGEPALEYEHYYAIIPVACGEIASSGEKLTEVEVVNKHKGFGFVYERPDLCGNVIQKTGKSAEIAIASYTHIR